MYKKLAGFVALFVLLAFCVSFAAMDPKIDGIIKSIRDNQGKIKDMSAKIVTIIRSDAKEKKTMEQIGSLMTKGEDKSRMEMTAPVNQITITNKDKIAVINPQTGQKFVQDLRKLRKQAGQDAIGSSPTDQTKILDYFNLSVEEKGIFNKSYVIIGVPKKKNQFMGKMKFYVDGGRNVPTKIEVYNAQDKLISVSDIEYKKIKDIWVISKNSSWIAVPGGKMDVEMKFEDIKINEGIPDKVFEIK